MSIRERLRSSLLRYHLWQAERHGKWAERFADGEREERVSYSARAWPQKGRKALKRDKE